MKYIQSLLLLLICWPLLPSKAARQPVSDAVTPLPAGAVTLTGGLHRDLMNSLEHWNKGVVPYAKLVDFFRKGRPQFALGEMWGKAVRSGCMFYRYTQDEELKQLLRATVDDMLSTQKANGSFSCVDPSVQPDGPGGDLWERKYVMLALEGFYEEVERDPKVLDALRRHADCIINQIGPSPKVAITSLGWSANHIESSTLLEPFMRLYRLTGCEAYLDFATYIVTSGGAEGYNLFKQSAQDVLPHKMGGPYPKAYEMLSLYEGLVEYYRVKGDPWLKQSFLNLYKNVKRYEMTITGNGGGDQPYHPAVYGEAWDHTALEQTNPDIQRMMETCTGVTWMKFCSQVFRLTGDASAIDAVEKYIYNGLLGAMKPSGDGFSYVNLLNGEKVTNRGWGMDIDGLPVTCCNLNGPMGLAYIPYLAVMQSAQGPVVNLFNAFSMKHVTPSGKPLRLRLSGDFPSDSLVSLRVSLTESETFTVSLRIPYWSLSTEVRVNGRKVDHVVAGRFLHLRRNWKDGDEVTVGFDMRAYVIYAPKGSNRAGDRFHAVKYGPWVMARDENTDPRLFDTVRVVADEHHVVKVRRVKPTLPGTRIEIEVPTTTGPIRMIDYASVNGWNGKKVCTWLPLLGPRPEEVAAQRRP